MSAAVERDISMISASAEQGPQARPGGDQGRPAPDHERHDPAGGLVRLPGQSGVGAPLPNPTGNRRFADRWDDLYPKAVACRRADLADLLTCFRDPTVEQRQTMRTTNAGASVRSGAAPDRSAPARDRTAMARILSAVFMHANRNHGLATPFALTHNS
jgi:hypothetical protein